MVIINKSFIMLIVFVHGISYLWQYFNRGDKFMKFYMEIRLEIHQKFTIFLN